jgi:hypothetical protein
MNNALLKTESLSPISYAKLLAILFSMIFLISACIPIIRTEYISPSWQGTLVNIHTGEPLVGIEVSDLYSHKKVTTDLNGYFQLAPVTSQFSLKLPVSSVDRTYQIEITLPQSQLRFSGQRLAANTTPSDFNLGRFPVELEVGSEPFLLQDQGDDIELSASLLENCGTPLQDAISLSQSARVYQQLFENKQALGERSISRKDVELSYHWALESWGNVGGECFRQDYERSMAFSAFYNLFYAEAQTYLISTRFDAEGD